MQHPLIRAVRFTGSLAGGGRSSRLCAARPDPIPFFRELGWINPMFVLPHALANRADTIGQGWAASLTLGVGQFCTNPGLAILVDCPGAEAFMLATTQALSDVDHQIMLTEGIVASYSAGCKTVAGSQRADNPSFCAERGARRRAFLGCCVRAQLDGYC